MITADHEYYLRVLADGGPDTVEFPQFFPVASNHPRRDATLIGRRNRAQGVEPEIDLGIHPGDRGVSTQHAVLRIRASGPTITDLDRQTAQARTTATTCCGTAKRRQWGMAIASTSALGPRSRFSEALDAQSTFPSLPRPTQGNRLFTGPEGVTVTERGTFAPASSGDVSKQHRELRHAREQSAASREIIAALGRDVDNPGAVLDTIVEYATRLCGARAAQLFLTDGDVFRVSRVSGETPEDYREYLLNHPIVRDRSSTVGRAAEDMRTHQVRDVLADADYGRRDLQSRAGFRTLLSTPMILQGEVVGVLSIWRTDVAPSTGTNANCSRSSRRRGRSSCVSATWRLPWNHGESSLRTRSLNWRPCKR